MANMTFQHRQKSQKTNSQKWWVVLYLVSKKACLDLFENPESWHTDRDSTSETLSDCVGVCVFCSASVCRWGSHGACVTHDLLYTLSGKKMMMIEVVRRLLGQNLKVIVHIYIMCMLLLHLNVWKNTFPIFFWKWHRLFLKTLFFGHCVFCTEPLGSHPKGCGYWCLPDTKQQRQ